MQIGWRTLQIAEKNPQVEDTFPQVRGLFYGFPILISTKKANRKIPISFYKDIIVIDSIFLPIPRLLQYASPGV